ncbi:hypothetical protein [Intestinimonas massiliensis (ex Afouda et al. 2020)]|uniref:hypothetical protein n=1 Tax=Intestinimonas massiliensis (ex Afouda et al. 2020) TaxID=1673721 RepID=UPI001031E5D0|nr:hypothetical protein [Intestinimonas massiliensis (ex Afouda et al. 2020)]
MAYIGAGRLDQPLEVLELRETATGIWEWVTLRRAWAQVEQTAKTNLFSKVGVGARDAAIVIRRQKLTLHNALRWRGQHLFLTSITHRDRNHLDVGAALVEPVVCTAQSYTTRVGTGNRPEKAEQPPVTFPGILTEKYVRYEQEDTYAKARRGLVLVTPKVIELSEGALVTVTEGPAKAVYNVQARHVLDPYKHEYEMDFSRDV